MVNYRKTKFDAETMEFEVWAAYNIARGRLIRSACYDGTDDRNVKFGYYTRITESQLINDDGMAIWNLNELPNGVWKRVDWDAMFIDELLNMSNLAGGKLGCVYHYSSETDTISQKAVLKIDGRSVYFVDGTAAGREVCGFTRAQIKAGRSMAHALRTLKNAATDISDVVTDINI